MTTTATPGKHGMDGMTQGSKNASRMKRAQGPKEVVGSISSCLGNGKVDVIRKHETFPFGPQYLDPLETEWIH